MRSSALADSGARTPARTLGACATALLLLVIASAVPPSLRAQQVADTLFRPEVALPAFPPGAGPRVLMDGAHGNAQLASGTYRPFARLLEHDGFRVAPVTSRFTRAALDAGDILVIINAQAPEKADDWSLPTPPAFTPEEVETVRDWVRDGGALLLVADHMPFPGATAALAREFGVDFMNGFAIDTVEWDPLVFRRSDGTLRPHPIANGGDTERIDSVVTFWGQAFRRSDERVRELLVLAQGVVSLNPDTAWRFSERTPAVAVGGWLQGATVEFGAGRVVILGEAGMLSAQLAGPRRNPMGMNAPWAKQNAQFTLNVLRWLAGRLEDAPVTGALRRPSVPRP